MRKLTFLLALLCASVMGWAKQYCQEALTLSGNATIYLSCTSPSAGNYQIVIEGENLNGLGGSFFNPGTVDLRTTVTSSTSTRIVCDIAASSAPTLYTPLYVMCPGEQNIGWPNDVEWGECAGGDPTPVTGEKFDPANASIDHSYFANWEWAQETNSTATYNSSTGEISVHIDNDKNIQWYAQVHLAVGFSFVADKYYDFSIKFHADKAVPQVTLKANDDVEMFYENQSVNLPEDEDFVWTKTDVLGKAGNNIFVFDFGHASANSNITISEISIIEKDAPSTPVDPNEYTAGGHTIHLDAYYVNDIYTLNITSTDDMQGLGGSFWNVNGAGADMRTNAGTSSYTVSGDKKTITCQVQSSSAPNIYTPLYVLFPGEVNFGDVTLNWEDRTPITSEYCNKVMSSGNTEAAFTWETDANGDVNITISETLGGAADAAYFRGNGITASKIKIGEGRDAITTYFTHPGNIAGQQTLTLTLTDPANAPEPGTKIYVESQIIEYATSKDGNAWPTLTFVYSYGGICNQLDAPTNVAVSADSVITFDAVAGATKYTAYVYLNNVEKYSQEVTNGGVLHFWPYEDGAYVVNVIASAEGKMDSDPSADYVWNLEARVVDLGNSEYCEHVMRAGTDTEAAFTWETDANGNVVITISETLGGAADATHFRGNALALGNFKVGAGQAAGSNYFSHPGTTTGNQLVLTATNAPALGEKIYYHGTVEYATSKDGNAWPTLDFEWTYGTECSGIAVSATSNNNEMGTAVVQKAGADVTSVEDGDEVTFIATVADAEMYQFVNWTKGGVEVSTSATYVTTITEATNLIANFDYIRNVYCHAEINSIQNKKLYLTLGAIGGGQYQIKIEGSAEAQLTGLNNANYTINWVTTDIVDGDKKMSGQDVPFNNARWAFDASGYGSVTATFGIAEGHTWEDIYVWNHAIFFSTPAGEVGYEGFPSRHNIDWTATCADAEAPVFTKAEAEILSESSVRLKIQASDNWGGILTYTIARAGAEPIISNHASGEEFAQEVTGLTAGTEYDFTVTVSDGVNNTNTHIVVTPVGDEEKPVMGAASLESKTWNSAIINVAATDNIGVSAYYIVELDNEYVAAEGKITVDGLTHNTAYVFTIKAKDAAGNISDNSAEVNFTTDVHNTVPTEAAPVPTWPAAQVKSIYSDAYTFAPASLNSYNEGWWDNPNMNEGEISGDHYLHYDLYRNGMIGWQYGEISVASMEKLHIDIFASKAGYVSIRPITVGGPNTPDTLNLAANQWNSFDIALSEFAGHDWTKLFQFAIEAYGNGGLVGEHISVDNVYFYRETAIEDDEKPTNVSTNAQAFYYSLKLTVSAEDNSGDVHFVVKNGADEVGSGNAVSGVATVITVNNLTPGTEYSLNVIASDAANNEADPVFVVASTLALPEAAPAPTHVAEYVKSVYSNSYDKAVEADYINYCEWWWQSPTQSQVQLEGNDALYYENLQANASYGIAWDANKKLDAAGYQYLHFHIYPLNSGTIEVYPVIQPEAEFHKVSQELVGGQWNEVVLDYSEKTFAPLNQIGFVNFTSLGAYFIDNLYFFNDPYTRVVTNGNYGTICLPKAGKMYGATLFEIADFANGMIYVDEVEGGVMEAGKPYIFQATSAQLNVYYTSAAIEETAGVANGLHGFYDLSDPTAVCTLPQDDGYYILYQNQYWLVSGRDAYINNYRAYIRVDEINYVAPAPGRRRVAMNVNGEQTATGINELNAVEAPVKMIIDGQLYILRGEKLYNVNGQIVK